MKINDKYPTKRLAKRFLKAFITSIIIAITFIIIMIISIKKVKADIDTQIQLQNFAEIKKIQDLKDYKIKNENEILSCLAEIESNNRNITIIDNNGLESIGVYQFQLSTLKDIYPTLNNNELQAIALDPTQAKEIARTLLFEKGEWWRWGNSIRKMFQEKCKHLDFEPDLLNSYLNEIGNYANI